MLEVSLPTFSWSTEEYRSLIACMSDLGRHLQEYTNWPTPLIRVPSQCQDVVWGDDNFKFTVIEKDIGEM